MKKADQVEQAPNSEAMFRRWKKKSSHLAKQGEQKESEKFLLQNVKLWMFDIYKYIYI